MSDPKTIALTAATRADYLSESEGPFLTDSQIHRETAETIETLLAEINVLKTAMGDAVCEIDDRDYENAKEVLEFALAGHVPASASGNQESSSYGTPYSKGGIADAAAADSN